MNTKTMRLPPRRVLTPDKRKEPDSAAASGKPPEIDAPPKPPAYLFPAQSSSRKAAAAPAKPVASNQLLAGYLAHEFLTKGTLFGGPWDPSRSQAISLSAPSVEPRKIKPSQRAEPPEPSERATELKRQRYVEVAHILQADGTHVHGIVNPAQLARFLKL